jgi:hypothetical protein
MTPERLFSLCNWSRFRASCARRPDVLGDSVGKGRNHTADYCESLYFLIAAHFGERQGGCRTPDVTALFSNKWLLLGYDSDPTTRRTPLVPLPATEPAPPFSKPCRSQRNQRISVVNVPWFPTV